ncbi:MAG: M13 family metallopeptidase [Legionellales bacterium]|nr:M13 family metallopeptidase [Legionellales bacterium]
MRWIGLLLCLTFQTVDAKSLFPGADALQLEWLDLSVPPGEDFYAYANGLWLKHHPIPPQYASWGTFSMLQVKVEHIVHQMLIDAAHQKKITPGSIEQKVGDFYFSGMDEAAINRLGVAPLQPDFKRIDAIQNSKDLQETIVYLQEMGVDACFDFGSMQDFKNSQDMIAAATQGGLTLPNRDYYLKQDPKFQRIRTAYLNYISQLFQLLGQTPTDANQQAAVVMRIETQMAEASLSQIEQRDPHAIYHMMTLKELTLLTPNFSWPEYLKHLGHSNIQRFNMGMPRFFKTWNTLLQTESLESWKTYLRWHLLDNYAPFLSEPFVNQHFKMNAALTGAKKILPRWQRVVNTENQALGFAIGKMYVEKYVPPMAKQQVMDILNNIRKALRQDLETLSWMSKTTRLAALKKLDMMGERVGYPDKWRDYSTLMIDRGPYVLNVKRANQFLVKRDLDKVGKPVDKSEWAMSPQTVNAYYDPSMNNINIPAGIMQPPFFFFFSPAALNYGSIGFVIGHEITHGFDDEGAQFDGHGNLKNWWTAADLKKFKFATHCISTQFSSYKVDRTLSIQGPLVVGEATADLGGLTLAYHAFRDSSLFKSAKTIQGFTPDQQFFIGVAHVWATNIRPEQKRTMVTIDPHPPGQFRVNGTLANMPQFQAAFDLPAVSPMVNQHRCVIW